MEKQPNSPFKGSEKDTESEQSFGTHPLSRASSGASLAPPPFQLMDKGDSGAGGGGDHVPEDSDKEEEGTEAATVAPESELGAGLEAEDAAPAAPSDPGTYTDPHTGLVFSRIETGEFADRPFHVLEREGTKYIYFDLVMGYVPYERAIEIMAQHADMPGPSRVSEGGEVRVAYLMGNIALRNSRVEPGAPPAPAPVAAPAPKTSRPKPKGGMMTMSELIDRDKKADQGRTSGTNSHLVGVGNGDGTMTYQEIQTLQGSGSGLPETGGEAPQLTLALESLEEPEGSGTATVGTETETSEPLTGEAAPEGKEEVDTESDSLSPVLRLGPTAPPLEAPAPADPLNPTIPQLMEAYFQGMAHENVWGDEAAATILANQMDVQFVIHQLNDMGVETNVVTVGTGGRVVHLRHQSRHFVVVDEHGNLLADVPSNGDCLFYAAYIAVHGTRPTPDIVAQMRAFVAGNLTLGQVQNIVTLLLADAQAGQEVHGVGQTLRALLLPVTQEARRRALRAQTTAPTGRVVGGVLTLEEARARMTAPAEKREEGTAAMETAPMEEGTLETTPLEEEPLEIAPLEAGALEAVPLEEGPVAPVETDVPLVAEMDEHAEEESAPEAPQREMHPFVPGVLDEYADARDEFEYNRTLMFAEIGRRNQLERQQKAEERARKKQAKPKPAPKGKGKEEEAPIEEHEAVAEMTVKEIQAFVAAHPPQPNQTVHPYIAANASHLPAGFHYYPHQIKAMVDALEKAAEGQREAALRRLAAFDPRDPTTWEMGEIQYLHGTAGIVETTTGGQAILNNLAAGLLGGNTRTRGTILVAGQALHAHLASGSWGMAFAYVLDKKTGLVHPVVYDIAYGRTSGNKYKWEKGGTDYNSDAKFE